jgi:translation initiation factor eIF-2B subunit alpha
MDRVDVVLVGSEAVVESGGLVAGVRLSSSICPSSPLPLSVVTDLWPCFIVQLGTYQIALLAKALNKPFYSLAESYKFLRLFPLSQSDLPLLPGVLPPLSFEPVLASPYNTIPESGADSPSLVGDAAAGTKKASAVVGMSREMLANNPRYDYTPRDLIHLIVSDVGILTPELVGSFCGIFSE